MSAKEESKNLSVTSVANDEDHESDWLEKQKHIWIKEQEIVASLVQVFDDPTSDKTMQSKGDHDGKCYQSSTIVVEDNPWYRILKQRFIDCDKQNNRYFGGVDVGFSNPPTETISESLTEHELQPAAVAVYVVIDATTMQTVYRDHAWIRAPDLPPYVSGFLAFREIHPLEQLVRKQMDSNPMVIPSAILVDGNGIFHPRHAGLACFLGVRTGIPTIGIGKTLLYIEKHEDSNHSHKDNDENQTSMDEYQWTRPKLDARIDRVLADVHQKLVVCVTGSDETACEEHPRGGELKKGDEGYKGLILPKVHHRDTIIGEGTLASSVHPGTVSREKLLEDLTPLCNGIAIPLEAPNRNHDIGNNGNNTMTKEDDRFRILGMALVGHGRAGERTFPQFPRSSSNAKKSTRPIIVSVGHKLSPAEAASITTSLSIFRIPEPVRQADLYGRELLRQRKML